MITKTIRFDLRRESRTTDRAAVMEMYAVPNGSRVILDVGDRYADWETAGLLSEYVFTHHFDLVGSVRACDAWEDALLRREPSP